MLGLEKWVLKMEKCSKEDKARKRDCGNIMSGAADKFNWLMVAQILIALISNISRFELDFMIFVCFLN